jgi:hypothetical protein
MLLLDYGEIRVGTVAKRLGIIQGGPAAVAKAQLGKYELG